KSDSMKYGLLLFLCLNFLPLFSQSWLKSGAEWHYSSDGETLRLYHHIKSEGDVSISGKTYQKVVSQRYVYFPISPSKDTLTGFGSESFFYRMNGDTLFQLVDLQNMLEDIVIIFRDQANWQSTTNLNDTLCTQIPSYTSSFYDTQTVNGIT